MSTPARETPQQAQQGKPAGRRRVGGTVRFVRDTALEAQKTKLPQMAAALSYRTIFGLIPVLFIALVALKFFISEEELTQALERALQFTGLSSITVEEVPPEAMMGPFPEHMPIPGAGGAETPAESEEVRSHLKDWITDLVNRVGMINFRAISIIGLLALIYAAIAMLVEVERSFNQIYRVPIGRSWARRITGYWFLLTLAPVLLAVTFYMGQQFTTWIAAAAENNWTGFAPSTEAAAEQQKHTVLLAAAGYFTTVAISTLMFFLAYWIVPNARVKALPALGGAVVAALLWETGKWGFTQYLTFSAGYARLYGSMALIPLFMLWVYITWIIVLSGLSIAYYLQHGRHDSRAQPRDAAVTPSIIDPGAILALMHLLARKFESDGRPMQAGELAKELTLEPPLVNQMLTRLLEAGFVHQVISAAQPAAEAPITSSAAFVLARPPQQIDAEAVLALGENLVCPLSKSVLPISEHLRQARHEAVRGRTLASFLESDEVSILSPLPKVPDLPRLGNSPARRPAPALQDLPLAAAMGNAAAKSADEPPAPRPAGPPPSGKQGKPPTG